MILLSENLKRLRVEKHLSQKQLAQKIGVTSSTIALYEMGDRFPSLNVLVKLSHFFSVSTDYLLGIEPQKQFCIDVSDLNQKQIESIHLIIENYRNL